MHINADNMHFKALNDKIRRSGGDVVVDNCLGQRYIGSGLSQSRITLNGIPGNALGAYLDGASITVNGNVQDAVGDTMNDGTIIVNGHAGDALGYSMRGGRIYVKGNAGYRTGIHMKQYLDKKPVIVIGGGAGSFLGEYMAGGMIIVLGLGEKNARLGYFIGAGMHGGKIFIRSHDRPERLPPQVAETIATEDDKLEMAGDLRAYAEVFSLDFERLLAQKFYMLKPNAKNPYKRLYVSH